MIVTTHSIVETQSLAESLGRAVRGGEIMELISDVGGGKTTFVKGLARGMEVQDVVQSPTFTISRLYHARDGLELHHFDFYRLHEAGIVAGELAESLAQPNAVVIVEWGEIVYDVLPETRLKVSIKSADETMRQFTFDIPSNYGYILQAITTFSESRSIV